MLQPDAKRVSDVILGWSGCNMRVSLLEPSTKRQQTTINAASADQGPALVMRPPGSSQAR